MIINIYITYLRLYPQALRSTWEVSHPRQNGKTTFRANRGIMTQTCQTVIPQRCARAHVSCYNLQRAIFITITWIKTGISNQLLYWKCFREVFLWNGKCFLEVVIESNVLSPVRCTYHK